MRKGALETGDCLLITAGKIARIYCRRLRNLSWWKLKNRKVEARRVVAIGGCGQGTKVDSQGCLPQ